MVGRLYSTTICYLLFLAGIPIGSLKIPNYFHRILFLNHVTSDIGTLFPDSSFCRWPRFTLFKITKFSIGFN